MVRKGEQIVQKVVSIIGQFSQPLTLRQIYYQLVSRQVIENKESAYKYLSRLLVKAREDGVIGYEDLVDRTRRPIIYQSLFNPEDLIPFSDQDEFNIQYHAVNDRRAAGEFCSRFNPRAACAIAAPSESKTRLPNSFSRISSQTCSTGFSSGE